MKLSNIFGQTSYFLLYLSPVLLIVAVVAGWSHWGTSDSTIQLGTGARWIQICFATLAFAAILRVAAFLAAKSENERAISKDNESRRLAEESRNRAARKEMRNRIRRELTNLNIEALQLAESLAEHTKSADYWLIRAQKDFSDGAFNPFWESIQKSTEGLSAYNAAVRRLAYYAGRYQELATSYEGNAWHFSVRTIPAQSIDECRNINEQLKHLTREAFCKIEFASIYESWKTNRILIEGFTSLSEAIDSMGAMLSRSIDTLDTALGGIASSFERHSVDARTQSALQHFDTMQQWENQRRRDESALQALQNLERE